MINCGLIDMAEVKSEAFFRELRDKLPFGGNKGSKKVRNDFRSDVRKSIAKEESELKRLQKQKIDLEAQITVHSVDVIRYNRLAKHARSKKNSQEETTNKEKADNSKNLEASFKKELNEIEKQIYEVKGRIKIDNNSLKETNNAKAKMNASGQSQRFKMRHRSIDLLLEELLESAIFDKEMDFTIGEQLTLVSIVSDAKEMMDDEFKGIKFNEDDIKRVSENIVSSIESFEKVGLNNSLDDKDIKDFVIVTMLLYDKLNE